jgi:hypothetical protein
MQLTTKCREQSISLSPNPGQSHKSEKGPGAIIDEDRSVGQK